MGEPIRVLATRWFDEIWNQRRPETIHELMAPECVAHMEGREVIGPEAFERFYHEMLEALPDVRLSVEEVIVEAENAVVRWLAKGTHRGGDLLAEGGRPVLYSGITWFKFRDGKAIELWGRWNQAGLYFRPESAPAG